MSPVELSAEQERIKDLLINHSDRIDVIIILDEMDWEVPIPGARANFFNEGTRTFQFSFPQFPGRDPIQVSIDDIVEVRERV